MKAGEEIDIDITEIEAALSKAREHGLEAEVMWSTFKHFAVFAERGECQASSPHRTYNLDWCLQAALDEWDI